MRRLVVFLTILFTLSFLFSFTQEPLAVPGGGVGEGVFVDATFSVEQGPQTKAIADGTTVDKLYAGLYEVNGTTYTWVADNADAPASFSSKAASVIFSGKIEWE